MPVGVRFAPHLWPFCPTYRARRPPHGIFTCLNIRVLLLPIGVNTGSSNKDFVVLQWGRDSRTG